MFVETSNIQFSCSTTDLGLRNAKLGIEGKGEENSKSMEPPELRNENPPETEKGVTGSTKMEENEDLHVNVGEWASHVGEPAPKLMSCFLDINEAENELPPTSHSSQLSIL